MGGSKGRGFAAVVGAVSLVLVTSAFSQSIVKREPPLGKLREGERLLVDDGSCPRGQIKEVIGGNHVKVGGFKQIERRRRCIPRP
jgi:hypothetical protein